MLREKRVRDGLRFGRGRSSQSELKDQTRVSSVMKPCRGHLTRRTSRRETRTRNVR